MSRRGMRRRGGPQLPARLGALRLANPVMAASGTAGLGPELGAHMDLASIGAVVAKSLSIAPWKGNPPPRLLPTAGGMLNSVGLQNPGVHAWLEEALPAAVGAGATVVASIWGRSAAEYGEAAAALARAVGAGRARGLVAVEANISCPNVEDRSRMFAHSVPATGAAIGAAAAALEGSGLPLLAKLSPNVTDLREIAAAALTAGADGLTLVNTLMGLAIDPVSGRPRLGAGGGGLSGPALHPVAVRAVHECRAAFPDVPIAGVGGVASGADAAELIAAGADAIQVGTATFADPRAPLRILRELRAWCARHDVSHLEQLKGRSHG